MTTKPPDTTDAAVWKDLVLWARKNNIVLTDLRVGEVNAQFIDAGRPGANAKPQQTDAGLTANLYTKYGGEALDAAISETDSQEEDDDE